MTDFADDGNVKNLIDMLDANNKLSYSQMPLSIVSLYLDNADNLIVKYDALPAALLNSGK